MPNSRTTAANMATTAANMATTAANMTTSAANMATSAAKVNKSYNKDAKTCILNHSLNSVWPTLSSINITHRGLCDLMIIR